MLYELFTGDSAVTAATPPISCAGAPTSRRRPNSSARCIGHRAGDHALPGTTAGPPAVIALAVSAHWRRPFGVALFAGETPSGNGGGCRRPGRRVERACGRALIVAFALGLAGWVTDRSTVAGQTQMRQRPLGRVCAPGKSSPSVGSAPYEAIGFATTPARRWWPPAAHQKLEAIGAGKPPVVASGTASQSRIDPQNSVGRAKPDRQP